jgi:hypothetical protein
VRWPTDRSTVYRQIDRQFRWGSWNLGNYHSLEFDPLGGRTSGVLPRRLHSLKVPPIPRRVIHRASCGPSRFNAGFFPSALPVSWAAEPPGGLCFSRPREIGRTASCTPTTWVGPSGSRLRPRTADRVDWSEIRPNARSGSWISRSLID